MKAMPLQTHNALVEQIGKIHYEKHKVYPRFAFVSLTTIDKRKNRNKVLIIEELKLKAKESN